MVLEAKGAWGISKNQGDAVSRNVSRDSGRDAALLGKPEHVAVERGIAEFRSGRPAVITASDITASDVAALALNNVRPAYRVSLLGTVFARTEGKTEQARDIHRAVHEAIQKVKANPSHD